jgi:hypothetical protein
MKSKLLRFLAYIIMGILLFFILLPVPVTLSLLVATGAEDIVRNALQGRGVEFVGAPAWTLPLSFVILTIFPTLFGLLLWFPLWRFLKSTIQPVKDKASTIIEYTSEAL